MEGRSGKRVEVTGARGRCSRRKEGGRETEEEVEEGDT